MTQPVRDWVRKGEADYRSMLLEQQASGDPNFDLICFLAQQCIEKLLKAYLLSKEKSFPKTHNLVTLSRLLDSPEFEKDDYDLKLLTEFASDFRYPVEFASKHEADAAQAACTRLRIKLRSKLSFEEGNLFASAS